MHMYKQLLGTKMQIKNLDKWNGTYAEIGQTNPLRWQNLRLLEDGSYEAVSRKWKCKDFMNEVVTSYHTGRDFAIYGFEVKHKDFFGVETEGLPILLHNCLAGFQNNLLRVNQMLAEDGMPEVRAEPLGDGRFFIDIPYYYLSNTLFMSQITLFIRLCNTEESYQTLQEMCNDKLNRQDQANLNACLKKPMKDFPAKLYDYIWYYDEQRNLKNNESAKTSTIQTSLMHNCGVVSWGWTTEEECV